MRQGISRSTFAPNVAQSQFISPKRHCWLHVHDENDSSTHRYSLLIDHCRVLGMRPSHDNWSYGSSKTERRLFSTLDVDELIHTSPIVAVWTDSTDFSAQPSLRVALWDDGRVLFAANDGEPNSTLRFGHILRDTTKELKHDIRKTGLFELKGHCYLVPDALVMYLLAAVDDYKHFLY